MDAGRIAAHEPWMHDAEEQSDEAADVGDAFRRLVDAYGHDVLVDRADEFGLTRKGRPPGYWPLRQPTARVDG
jgi:hypothetical protein